jgi:hypothetical protein
MAERHDQQGTGKHGHKDSQEPWPHTKDEGQQHSRGSEGEQSGGSSKGQGQSGSQNADLKEREYKDEKGEVHHHTKTYMEDHEGKKDR